MFATVRGFDVSLFEDFRRLQREVEELFTGRDGSGHIRSLPRTTFPATRVDDTPEKVDVYISAPGIDAKALDISIRQNVLSVIGRRQAQADDKAPRRRQERFSGDFRRVIALPEDVDHERVEATYVDGIVRISMQRRQPRQIEIH